MSESKFLPNAIYTSAVLIVALMASCNATNVYTRAEAARAMQAKGADPLDIACALGEGTERYCQLRSASKAAVAR